LHDPGMVCGKPQAVFCYVDMHLVRKVDGLEELVEGPSRAGDRPEQRGLRALGVH